VETPKQVSQNYYSNKKNFKTSSALNFEADEVMVVSDTGGAKASKESQLAFIDPVALYELGKVAGMGLEKYGKWNFLKGYDWSLNYSAMMRHMEQFWAGEDVDEESGLLHVVHAAWHALALTSFQVRNIGTDDRFKEI
jgi:hypothetical protein